MLFTYHQAVWYKSVVSHVRYILDFFLPLQTKLFYFNGLKSDLTSLEVKSMFFSVLMCSKLGVTTFEEI